MKNYKIVFNLINDNEKSLMVQKKTKKINKTFFIPKSIIVSEERYTQEKKLWKDCSYERERIEI
jgi:hypothetical protein